MASPTPWRLSWKASSIPPSELHVGKRSVVYTLRLDRRRARFALSAKSASAAGREVPSLKKCDSDSVSGSKSQRIDGSAGEFDDSGDERIEALNLKSVSRERSTWRRILFASKRVRSIIMLNVVTMIYASDIPVLKEVEAVVDPAVFNCVRFIISAIPFIPFVIQAKGDVKTRNAGIELGVWISLGYFAQSIGLLTSDAGRASFISMFTVIVVAVVDGMLGVVVPAHTFFGALMSVIGVVVLESSGSPPTVGDFFNLLSAVFFGIHMLRTEHISRSTSKGNFLALLGYEVCVVACLSTVWYLYSGTLQPSTMISTWTEFRDFMVGFPWIPALYTGVLSTGLCLWIEMTAMCDISATETAIVYGLEPIWGAGFAWFLLGERWGTMGWIGASLVLGGSLIVQIFGSLYPPSVSDSMSVNHTQQESDKSTILLPSDNRKSLISSPVVVSSAKRAIEQFKNK
ncbi:unnamed protein product [Rhodiola kirilowii]